VLAVLEHVVKFKSAVQVLVVGLGETKFIQDGPAVIEVVRIRSILVGLFRVASAVHSRSWFRSKSSGGSLFAAFIFRYCHIPCRGLDIRLPRHWGKGQTLLP